MLAISRESPCAATKTRRGQKYTNNKIKKGRRQTRITVIESDALTAAPARRGVVSKVLRGAAALTGLVWQQEGGRGRAARRGGRVAGPRTATQAASVSREVEEGWEGFRGLREPPHPSEECRSVAAFPGRCCVVGTISLRFEAPCPGPPYCTAAVGPARQESGTSLWLGQ